jgi:TRAP-type C4-dicarboxylate transport system permease small subunit
MARLLVLWVSVLGASLITRENKHIRIDLLALVLPGKWRLLRERVLSAVSSALCALMFLVSLRHIGLERAFGEHLLLGIPTWVCQIILPVGFLSMSFRFLIGAVASGSGVMGGRRG